jgi:hypothetical protein
MGCTYGTKKLRFEFLLRIGKFPGSKAVFFNRSLVDMLVFSISKVRPHVFDSRSKSFTSQAVRPKSSTI